MLSRKTTKSKVISKISSNTAIKQKQEMELKATVLVLYIVAVVDDVFCSETNKSVRMGPHSSNEIKWNTKRMIYEATSYLLLNEIQKSNSCWHFGALFFDSSFLPGLDSLATLSRSQSYLLISHYPLYFKSIVNYLQNALSLSCYKWAALGRLKFARLKDLVLHRVKTVLPLLLRIGPSVCAVPHCNVFTWFFSQFLVQHDTVTVLCFFINYYWAKR